MAGEAGFLGSNLVKKFRRKGYRVRVLNNFSTGKFENIREFEADIEIQECDLSNFHKVIKVTKDCDYILHQADLPSLPRSVKDPIPSNGLNISGLLNVLLAAKKEGVKKEVVFASSLYKQRTGL